MPWNAHQHHHRKFLLAPGRYIDGHDRIGESELVFWGEWEPPSRIVRRWPQAGRLPRALHRPYWVEPPAGQNTDPWVWGERMIYSNCKQLVGPGRRPTSMQRLTRGSVICFGSIIDGEFCVDTVFVVASAEHWVPDEVSDLDVNDAFKTCTGNAIRAAGRDGHVPLTLYRGATFDDQVEGMFSFVPARRADADDLRFRRPALYSRLINRFSRQSTWGSRRPLSLSTVRNAWEEVLHQVMASDLVPAIWIQTPSHDGGDAPLGIGKAEQTDDREETQEPTNC